MAEILKGAQYFVTVKCLQIVLRIQACHLAHVATEGVGLSHLGTINFEHRY